MPKRSGRIKGITQKSMGTSRKSMILPRWFIGKSRVSMPIPQHIQRSNAGKSVIRSRVTYVFADQKSQKGLFIRTGGITRTIIRIGLKTRYQVQELSIKGFPNLLAAGKGGSSFWISLCISMMRKGERCDGRGSASLHGFYLQPLTLVMHLHYLCN